MSYDLNIVYPRNKQNPDPAADAYHDNYLRAQLNFAAQHGDIYSIELEQRALVDHAYFRSARAMEQQLQVFERMADAMEATAALQSRHLVLLEQAVKSPTT